MKSKLKSSILAGVAALLFLFPNIKESTLDEIAKPYLGIYECTEARVGSKNVLEEFSDLRLELLKDGNFTLFYKPKKGKRKQAQGKYSYDEERGVLVLEEEGGLQREFPFTNGQITVSFPVGKKTVVLQFQQR